MEFLFPLWLVICFSCHLHIHLLKHYHTVSEMAQEVRVLANKSENPSSVLGIHMVERENWLLKTVFWISTLMPWHMRVHAHTHTKWMFKRISHIVFTDCYHNWTLRAYDILRPIYCLILTTHTIDLRFKEQIAFVSRAKCMYFVKKYSPEFLIFWAKH